MSALSVRCPRCGGLLAVQAQNATSPVQCPACGQVVALTPAAPTPSPNTGPIPPHLLKPAGRAAATPPAKPEVSIQNTGLTASSPDDDPAPTKPRSGLWLELGFLAGICMLVAVVVLIVVMVRRGVGSMTKDEALAATIGQTTVMEVASSNASQGPAKWSDASHLSLSMNKVVVSIRAADYGEVRGRDAEKYVIVSHDKTLLTLRLKILSFRERPYQYNSWYTNVFDTEAGQKSATLMDDRGHKFEPHLIRTQELTAHTPSATLGQNQPLEDVLIFKLPEDSSPDKCAYYRLELPAAAYGKSGTYRFEIPRAMIQSPLNLGE